MNGKKIRVAVPPAVLDEATRARLDALYAPANQKLRAVLLAAGYTDLPAWLAGA